MTLYDLLFIVVFLSSVATLGTAAYQLLRGRGARAGNILLRLAVSAAIYTGMVVMVSAFSPRRVMGVGDQRCFDDWCFAVAHVDRTTGTSGLTYKVDIRLFSRARGRPQRANDVAVYLLDDHGTRFSPEESPSNSPFNVLLGPGESVITTRTFHLPPAARDVGLVLEHGGSGPGLFIIGDDLSLLHKRTIVRLD